MRSLTEDYNQEVKKTSTFLTTRQKLLDNSDYRFHLKEHLAVLAWLCKEVGRLKGDPCWLDPKCTSSYDSKELAIPTWGREEDLNSILTYALETLPNTPEDEVKVEKLPTLRALRIIVELWGERRKGWNVVEYDYLKTKDLPNVSFPQIQGLAQRTLTIQLNNCHAGADRIYSVHFRLTHKGTLRALITHGYPRDASSWTWGSSAAEYHKEAAEFLFGLDQKPDEEPFEAMARITQMIETHTTQGKSDPWPFHIRNNLTAVQEEEATYHKLERKLSVSGDFARGSMRPDAGTKAKFGANEPHFYNEEVASMLAEFIHDPKRTESELENLSKSLKKVRALGAASKKLAEFRDSISNRDWGNRPPRENEPLPKYELLKEGLALAAKAKGRVFIWVPKTTPMTGLKRIPWKTVKLDESAQKITYNGVTNYIAVIRQFDVLG